MSNEHQKLGKTQSFDWVAALTFVPDPPARIDGFKPKGSRGGLDRDLFLSELNSARKLPQTVSKLRFTRAGRPSLLHHLPNIPVLMNAQLRMYVDEWLDTGVARGVEDPRRRDLTKAPNACWAVRHFAAQQKSLIEPARDGLYLRFPDVGQNTGLRGFRGPSEAIDNANLLFSSFLLCEWRHKLAKCRECREYFELSHCNRAYKRGIACPACARTRSASLSIAKARKQAEARLHALVATRFKKRILANQNWHRDQTIRSVIISFLNKQISGTGGLQSVYPRGLTSKWLSWDKNRTSIERLVQHRK